MDIKQKPVMIIERNHDPLSVCEFVSSNKKTPLIIGGPFTIFDIKNRNERIYTAPKFLPCLSEMNERMSSGMAVYGEFDHPDVFDTSMRNASHLVKEAIYNKELNRVDGKIQILPTYWGREVTALHEAECPIFVSSRAAGVTNENGTVDIKKLFTYDIVADPGFPQAKMSSINESCGYKDPNANFRIYEMSDESKINELFNMNQNDLVTKKQLTDYSLYLSKELQNVRKACNEAVKKGKMEPKKLENLLEYYDSLNSTNIKMVEYLDYLAETVQIVVNENKHLKNVSEKLIIHNDYLASQLEKTSNYVQYVAEKLDENIIYAEYIAENLDRNIIYSEYISEHLDKNIAYNEYLAENVDNAIIYVEYIKEHLDSSIKYSEYIIEQVESNVAYVQYIAENLDGNIEYISYVANELDKNIGYSGLIAEKLNGNKLNEDKNNMIPSLLEYGFGMNEDEDEITDTTTIDTPNAEITNTVEEPMTNDITGSTADETIDGNKDETVIEGPIEKIIVVKGTTVEEVPNTENPVVEPINETPEEETNSEPETIGESKFNGESDDELSLQIDNLIAETKKRKIVENNDLHFLKFLNKPQVGTYYALTNEEQDLIKLNMTGKEYFSDKDVLKLISEALSAKNETIENRIIRLMPENIKPTWNNLNESTKMSILSQAKLYPDLTNENTIEYFWNTRKLKTEVINKVLVDHDALIQENKLSDKELNSIMEKFTALNKGLNK